MRRNEANPGIEIIRWIARLWSLASIILFAHFATTPSGLPAAAEMVGLAFFPVGVTVGLLIAWRHEGFGGIVTVLSLAAFYVWNLIMSGQLPHGPFFVLLSAPGFLFALIFVLEESQRHQFPNNAARSGF